MKRSTNTFHKLTALFATNNTERALLVNDNWQNYDFMLRMQKWKNKYSIYQPDKMAPLKDCYINFPSPATTDLKKIMEYNHPTQVAPLLEHGGESYGLSKGDSFKYPVSIRT